MSFGIKSPPLKVLVIQGWRASSSWRNGYEGKDYHYSTWTPRVWFEVHNLILLTTQYWTWRCHEKKIKNNTARVQELHETKMSQYNLLTYLHTFFRNLKLWSTHDTFCTSTAAWQGDKYIQYWYAMHSSFPTLVSFEHKALKSVHEMPLHGVDSTVHMWKNTFLIVQTQICLCSHFKN